MPCRAFCCGGAKVVALDLVCCGLVPVQNGPPAACSSCLRSPLLCFPVLSLQLWCLPACKPVHDLQRGTSIPEGAGAWIRRHLLDASEKFLSFYHASHYLYIISFTCILSCMVCTVDSFSGLGLARGASGTMQVCTLLLFCGWPLA